MLLKEQRETRSSSARELVTRAWRRGFESHEHGSRRHGCVHGGLSRVSTVHP